VFYNNRDLSAEDDGDLVIENGDLVVDTVQASMRHYLLTWSMTTRGGFSFDPQVGWGGEGYVGKPNTPPVHQLMERDLGYSFGLADDLSLEDLVYKVTYIDVDTAGVVVSFDGTVIEDDGSTPTNTIVMGFSFPFTDGQITIESESYDEVDS
jgi:hypothetical protein